ncbi:MAG: RluA family pseudouridine synthase [Streptococcaceae bacterium]|jgi:23S rRNA pseudouridine1911/1915/1917 synthase|nr:RluA family pseudouridine synthase [Streptococcaceae bacterium]
MKTREIKVSEQFDGLTVEELLKLWLVPKAERHLIRMEKRLTVNGTIPNYLSFVKANDIIKVNFKESSANLKNGNPNLCDVLYENEDVIVVNKPENMKTHANFENEIALQNHVSAYCGHDIYVVHRLDFETSGAVLFAKNQFVLPILSSLLEKRAIHREYDAIVHGTFSEERFSINKNIGRDRHDSKKRIVSKQGQIANTQVEVLKIFKQFSLIHCILSTGRTHQIRIHLSSLNHPILGDVLYGGKSAERMLLHAQKMILTLPFSFEKIEISAPSPSFDNALNSSKIMMKQTHQKRKANSSHYQQK